MRVEAENLQAAFQKAALELKCSVTELDVKEIIQHPRGGMMGFFKKNAIIEVTKEGAKRSKPKKEKKKQQPTQSQPQVEEEIVEEEERRKRKERTPQADINEILPIITKGVNELIEHSCFDVNVVKIEKYNDESILIELDGEDAALLIGKEGYRYKAFSYLLYNWINIKYGFGIRLEIAQFLKNQETMIEKYLTPVIERIQTNGKGQTKPLDGVLIKIALERLRQRFPDKYVGIKTGREGVKFIVINDFNRK